MNSNQGEWWQRTTAYMTAPVDVAFLAFFRVVVGGAFFYSFLSSLSQGWVEFCYVSPEFHFKYFGFEWVQPLPGRGMTWLYQTLCVCALLVATGTVYRLSSILLATGYSYVFLIDKSQYQNHYYLLVLTAWLIAFLPAHRAFAVDSLRSKRSDSSAVPRWCLWIVRFQVAMPYFFGGIAKLNSDWIHGQPMRMKLANSTWYPLVGSFFTEEWCVQGFVWGGLLFDLLVVPFLLWKRSRLIAFFVALCFHLMNATLFSIGVFPWFMILATMVFFEPGWPRVLRSHRHTGSVRAPEGLPQTPQWLAAGMILYVTVQCLLPWRHLFYRGNVNWTEEGHFFAWHMKLRDKKTVCKFRWHDPETGDVGDINVLHYITQQQASHATSDPEMIVQLCRFLKQEVSRDRKRECRILALNLTSLNGRRPQPLVNPTLDLGSVDAAAYLPREVFVPLTEPLKPFQPWRVPRKEWIRHVDVDNYDFWFGPGRVDRSDQNGIREAQYGRSETGVDSHDAENLQSAAKSSSNGTERRG